MSELTNKTPTIGFYEGPYYMLSNFSAHEVLYMGVTYKTSEHAYQVAKFQDDVIRSQIANATSAYEAREIGQQTNGRTLNFDKVAVMKEIMKAKLLQHEDVKAALLSTGNTVIEKNHPRDEFWGTAPDGTGQNVMGKIWMELRDELKIQSK